MENFSNEIIDTNFFPKHEEVVFTRLHPKYIFVIAINLAVFILILFLGAFLFLYFKPNLLSGRMLISFGILCISIILIVVFFSIVNFRKKGFAFREHDVLYRHGVLATNTIIIPYNRVQHVALHEGLVSTFFGLAEIEIFTAGGNSGDIQIAGIEKEHAENIKQLLMQKIQKQL